MIAKDIHENSAQSFEEQNVLGKPSSYRKKIWMHLTDFPEQSFTDRDIMEHFEETDVNNIRPEITRLVQAGLIEEGPRRTCRVTGKVVRTTRIKSAVYCERNGLVK